MGRPSFWSLLSTFSLLFFPKSGKGSLGKTDPEGRHLHQREAARMGEGYFLGALSVTSLLTKLALLVFPGSPQAAQLSSPPSPSWMPSLPPPGEPRVLSTALLCVSNCHC